LVVAVVMPEYPKTDKKHLTVLNHNYKRKAYKKVYLERVRKERNK
jgi:hypothetical protein